MKRTLSLAALVAAVVYFFDRDNGKRRRRMAVDRTAGLLRGKARRLDRARRGAVSGAHGVAQKAKHLREEEKPAPNDATLKAKVESEVFRAVEVPKGKVDVNAEDGVVYLRAKSTLPISSQSSRRRRGRFRASARSRTCSTRPKARRPRDAGARPRPTGVGERVGGPRAARRRLPRRGPAGARPSGQAHAGRTRISARGGQRRANRRRGHRPRGPRRVERGTTSPPGWSAAATSTPPRSARPSGSSGSSTSISSPVKRRTSTAPSA